MVSLKENQIFLSDVIELYPTEIQEKRLMEYIYASNYIYDIALSEIEKEYVNYLNSDRDYPLISKIDISAIISNIRKMIALLKIYLFIYVIVLHIEQ